jgi:hypothetical protein
VPTYPSRGGTYIGHTLLSYLCYCPPARVSLMRRLQFMAPVAEGLVVGSDVLSTTLPAHDVIGLYRALGTPTLVLTAPS